MDALIDPNGHATKWDHDLQGRVTRELRPDGHATVYAYEATTSRLRSVTDAKQQTKTYAYDRANAVISIAFTDAEHSTPDVDFAYDSPYGRLISMVDGSGTTTFAYQAVTLPPQLGAGRLMSEDGPLDNDTITYAYDELGRVVTRAVNGASNTVTWAYDVLSRTTSEQNVLGTFGYTYDGPTARLATVTYPNSQTSEYSYYGNAGDRRLQTIHHKYPNSATLSRADYTYDAAGRITTLRQQADATAVLWAYGYDAADQLVSAWKSSTDQVPQVLQRYAYGYDPAGNRTLEQVDDVVMQSTYDSANELVGQAVGGALLFEGTLDEPGTVTIAGRPAEVTAEHVFRGTATVTTGTNTVTIAARDATGNIRTNAYEVDVSEGGRTLVYDANGNLSSDGTRSFEWDARNQLVAVAVGSHRSEFTYDGMQRRVRVVEKMDGTVQSDSRVVWCKEEICEVRDADGTVTRRVTSHGEELSGVAHLFATDHLGSVTEVTDGSGVLIARYAFDPWGRRAVVSGTDATTVGFTGHDVRSVEDIFLSQYRVYDPGLGRWLSNDPLGDVEGPNRYAYVRNAPTGARDVLGLQGMNASERRLCLTNPFDCWKVRGCRDDALSATVSKFSRQGHNDVSDAFRHCYWSCCMAQKIGVAEAKRFGDAHENFPGNDPCERDMDFYNNDVGRRVGSSSPTGNCYELCNPKDLMCEKPKNCKS